MIDELMEKLLEEPVVDNNEIVFTSRAVELIHEISEKCKGIQIVEQTREQAEEYAKDLSAEEVYYDMLRKIVDLLKGDYGFMCQYDDEPDFETVWSSIFDLDSLVIYRAEGDPRKKKFVTDNRLHDLIRRG